MLEKLYREGIEVDVTLPNSYKNEYLTTEEQGMVAEFKDTLKQAIIARIKKQLAEAEASFKEI